eukprot:TRINITY_DN8285_c0_g3_i2.p1 TRINITY_DN8285_c0_g3~~TRINITY_DN8285_c0_g3_i2.p1  ORF type:complete len:412 (-),score=94.30 TRINITY_DN8285_c0_g3_i2:92-1327(-)
MNQKRFEQKTETLPQISPPPDDSKLSEDGDVGLVDDQLQSVNPQINYSVIFEAEFQFSVRTFFDSFFSDDAKFSCGDFNNLRGDRDVKVSKWVKDETLGYSREITFTSDVKNAPVFAPKQTRVHRVQRYKLDSKRLIIDSETVSLDVPYGDSFRLAEKWEIISASEDEKGLSTGCRLKVSFGILFSKSVYSMMQRIITNLSTNESVEAVKGWHDNAMKFLSTPPQPNGSAGPQASARPTRPKQLTPQPNRPQQAPLQAQKPKRLDLKTGAQIISGLIKQFVRAVPAFLIVLVCCNLVILLKLRSVEYNLEDKLSRIETQNTLMISLHADQLEYFSSLRVPPVAGSGPDSKPDIHPGYWKLRAEVRDLEKAIAQCKKEKNSKSVAEETRQHISSLNAELDDLISKLQNQPSS